MRSGVNREVSGSVGWGGGDCVVVAGKGDTRGEEKHGQADSEERYWSSISDSESKVSGLWRGACFKCTYVSKFIPDNTYMRDDFLNMCGVTMTGPSKE